MALTPNSPAAHRALGNAYIDRGQESAGYAELVIALLLNPDDTDVLAALGRVHLTAGRPAAAVDALEKAVALRPSEHEALRALGAALIQVGRTAEGDTRLEESARAQAAAVEEQRRLRTFGMLLIVGFDYVVSLVLPGHGRAHHRQRWRGSIPSRHHLSISTLRRRQIV